MDNKTVITEVENYSTFMMLAIIFTSITWTEVFAVLGVEGEFMLHINIELLSFFQHTTL